MRSTGAEAGELASSPPLGFFANFLSSLGLADPLLCDSLICPLLLGGGDVVQPWGGREEVAGRRITMVREVTAWDLS